MTVHKSQGSEFERVLLILPENDEPAPDARTSLHRPNERAAEVEIWASEAVLRAAIADEWSAISGLRDALHASAQPLEVGSRQSGSNR